MRNRIHNRQRFSLGKITLLLGISSILLPPFFSFGNSLCVLLTDGQCVSFILPLFYPFIGVYLLIIILGGALGVIDLCEKPRLLHKENTKTIIGLALIIFSLVTYGRIIIFSEFFQSIFQSR